MIVDGVKAVLVLLAISCSSRSERTASVPPPPVTRHDAGVAADATAVDAGPAPPWWQDSRSYAAQLSRDGGDSVVLVAGPTGVVAEAADGAWHVSLIDGRVEHPQYDSLRGVLWFVRDKHLEALDLGAPQAPAVVVVDAMPDLPYSTSRCDVCVHLDLDRATVGVEKTPDDPRSADQHLLAIATAARPTLTKPGAELLARLRDRDSAPRILELDTTTVPVPADIDLDHCDHMKSTQHACCAGGCRHPFELAKLGWQLVIAGRTCDCVRGECTATCVLRDPTSGQFASVLHPERWSRSAKPTAGCHPTLSPSGTAYAVASHVCTRHGCKPLSGELLDWLVPGFMTAPVPEDRLACPE